MSVVVSVRSPCGRNKHNERGGVLSMFKTSEGRSWQFYSTVPAQGDRQQHGASCIRAAYGRGECHERGGRGYQ